MLFHIIKYQTESHDSHPQIPIILLIDTADRAGRAMLTQSLQRIIIKPELICIYSTNTSSQHTQPHQPGDVILLTGVGEVFPLLRVHNLLNDMLADFGTVPVVVMYPGSFDGRQLKLFNKENASNYYRAFDIS